MNFILGNVFVDLSSVALCLQDFGKEQKEEDILTLRRTFLMFHYFLPALRASVRHNIPCDNQEKPAGGAVV